MRSITTVVAALTLGPAAGSGGMARVWLTGAALDGGQFLFGVDCFGVRGGCASAGLRHRALRYDLRTGALAARVCRRERARPVLRASGI